MTYGLNSLTSVDAYKALMVVGPDGVSPLLMSTCSSSECSSDICTLVAVPESDSDES